MFTSLNARRLAWLESRHTDTRLLAIADLRFTTMAEFEVRPLSVFRGGDWRTPTLSMEDEPGPSVNRVLRAGSSQGSFSSRRRSSAANAPPAGPPPDLPIPSLPPLSESSSSDLQHEELSPDNLDDGGRESYFHAHSPNFVVNPFQRQSASPQLAAVAAFSQSRLAASPLSPHSNYLDNATDSLSDSPPRSLLPRQAPPPQLPPPQAPPPQAPAQEINPERLMLSPTDSRPHNAPARPSSRRVLTRALELAREAVRLDSTNDDPRGAIEAYGQSVTLLKEVMERVMRGEDTGDHRRRNGRRRSIVAQEEEVRRLRSIVRFITVRFNVFAHFFV